MSANLIVGKDPSGNKVPVAVDAGGKLQIGGVQLDNLNVNTDQIENKIDIANANLATIAADLAGTLDVNVVSGGGGGGGGGTVTANAGTDAMGVPAHNYKVLNYTGSNVSSIGYYTGGNAVTCTGGTLIKTKTINYSGSNIASVGVS